VSVNPIRTGYSAIADDWIGIRPGTDGLFILALIQELLRAGKIDEEYLCRYTNAPLARDPGRRAADHGLFARDASGQPLVFDSATQGHRRPGSTLGPQLTGKVFLPTGAAPCRPFIIVATRYLEPQYAPDAVAARDRHRRRCHPAASPPNWRMPPSNRRRDRPARGPTGPGGGTTRHDRPAGQLPCHAGHLGPLQRLPDLPRLHVLQMLLGASIRRAASATSRPTPSPAYATRRQADRPRRRRPPGKPMPGPPLGFPTSPQDLLVEADGTPRRLDKAFSWENPLAAHGMMHMVIRNAWAGDPYKIDTLFIFMANMAWNSSMNTPA
jgi:anaerobic selenocysteine-containing dehydrogenase